MAQETAADGISVFAIEPGLVRTSLSAYAQHAPEVTERAPQVQQWFQMMFAEGHDTPIERAVELVLRLAAGHADVLSGAYLRVTDDLDALVQQARTQPLTARRTLRLQP